MAIINQAPQEDSFSIEEMDEAISSLEAIIEEASNDDNAQEIIREIEEAQQNHPFGLGQ